MPDFDIYTRNAANTANVALLAPAAATVSATPNDLGSVTLEIDNDDPLLGSLVDGTIVRVNTPGLAAAYRLSTSSSDEVSEGSEGAQTTTVEGDSVMVDWEHSLVDFPLGPFDQAICHTYPQLTERAMHWSGFDYDEIADGWSTTSNIIAVQGWPSTFYTNEPSGWSDPSALWIGPYSGTHENAPSGEMYFVRYALVGLGPKRLQFAGDNIARAYVNGIEVGSAEFKQPGQYDFEVTTAGWIKLGFHLTNAADDGPVGGNPTGLIFVLRDGPDGAIICHSDADVLMLAYPSTAPYVRLGRMIRRIMLSNPKLTPWSVTGTEEEDQNGNAYPVASDVSFRIGSNSCLAAISALADVWIDWRAASSALQLQVVLKNAWRFTSPVVLTSGYSAAADASLAPQSVVNLTDLAWDIIPPLCDHLMVRFETNVFYVGAGSKRKFLDMGAISDPGTAVEIATAYYNLYAVPQATATVAIDPNTGADVAFNEWARLEVPARGDPDSTTLQNISELVYELDNDGIRSVSVAVGPPRKDEEEWLDRMVQRGSGPGSLSGRASFASESSGGTPRFTRPSSSEWTLWASSTGSSLSGMVGTTATPGNPPVPATLQALRLRGSNTGATGTSGVTLVLNGADLASISLTAGQTFAGMFIERSLTTSDRLSVRVASDGGHTGLILQASVSELSR